ncbi:hypothetical protein FA04_14745 [Ensifer adhaerens]|uniref:Uncharacterized protein n=1 Tax=Ensifer adhaerens TaxID=106592 RepID=A0ABY8HCM8_ENSAD|nr:hypothetical protein [Ensifer adhaerens]ANK73768.1 hypothetical protein FA04_14745 [Ensifer adhaerens]KDP70269.1 hypothetical protein FA04_28950 [Ensifer adhaerens]WFP89855.1 hypothetical protein P4B07_14975 [Ensifer adhaerens]
MTDITDEMVNAYKAAYRKHVDDCLLGLIPAQTDDIMVEATRRGLSAALSRPIDPKAEVEPVAWRCRDEKWSEKYWHYFTKEPRHKEPNEVWEPLYASPSIVAPAGVKPKPLEWQNASTNWRMAKSIIGTYAVWPSSATNFLGQWLLQLNAETLALYPSEGEAKAAGQAHFDAAILSALTPAEKAGVGDGDARAAAIEDAASLVEDMVDDDCFPLAERHRIASAIRALSTTKPAQGDGELPDGWRMDRRTWRRYPFYIGEEEDLFFVRMHHKTAGVSSHIGTANTLTGAIKLADSLDLPDHAAALAAQEGTR